MTSAVQRGSSPSEVDDPTQPFSRPEIEKMRRSLEGQPGPEDIATPTMRSDPGDYSELATDPELSILPLEPSDDWFERSGRWIRISLAALDHLGYGGAPDGMIGSADARFMVGEVGGQCRIVQTSLRPCPASSELEWLGRARRRKWGWALALASSVLVGLAAWAWPELRPQADLSPTVTDLEPESPERQNRRQGGPLVISAAPVRNAQSPAGALAQERQPVAKPSAAQHASRKRSARHRGPDCQQHRREAEHAKRSGDWAQLEQLAQRDECWRRPQAAQSLHMRALFELERYQDCVEIGANASTEEVEKWANNCRRAQQ